MPEQQAAQQATTFHQFVRGVLNAHGLARTFVGAPEFALTLEHPQKGQLTIRKGVQGDPNLVIVDFPNYDRASAFINQRPDGIHVVLRAIRNEVTEEIVPSDKWRDWIAEIAQRRWDLARVLQQQHAVE